MDQRLTPRITLYDTTLRDGAQSEDVSFSSEDKLRIAERLDALGVHYIEGGWPGSNPKDIAFFKAARSLPLKHARLTAFGATRRARHRVSDDPSIKALLASRTPAVTIFGSAGAKARKIALTLSTYSFMRGPGGTNSAL